MLAISVDKTGESSLYRRARMFELDKFLHWVTSCIGRNATVLLQRAVRDSFYQHGGRSNKSSITHMELVFGDVSFRVHLMK